MPLRASSMVGGGKCFRRRFERFSFSFRSSVSAEALTDHWMNAQRHVW